MFLIHCVIHKDSWNPSMTAAGRRAIRAIRAICTVPAMPVGERRGAVHVLGPRNVHARVLGEKVARFEEDADVLHGHTAKPTVSITSINVNQILTRASPPGAGCASCLQSLELSCAKRTGWGMHAPTVR